MIFSILPPLRNYPSHNLLNVQQIEQLDQNRKFKLKDFVLKYVPVNFQVGSRTMICLDPPLFERTLINNNISNNNIITLLMGTFISIFPNQFKSTTGLSKLRNLLSKLSYLMCSTTSTTHVRTLGALRKTLLWYNV